METSYIVHRLPAWHVNIRKQVVKAPKLHFFDSGLTCYLLGIRDSSQLRHHPLRGAIFESWVVAEIYKSSVHSGYQPGLYHYREVRGPEIDLVIAQAEALMTVEIKSGATVTKEFFKNLKKFSGRMTGAGKPRPIRNHIVYGGDDSQQRSDAHVLSWRDIQNLIAEDPVN